MAINPFIDKVHLVSLSKFIDLKHIPKLRVCHQVAKHESYVIIGTWITLEDSTNETNAPEEINDDSNLVVYYPKKNPHRNNKSWARSC